VTGTGNAGARLEVIAEVESNLELVFDGGRGQNKPGAVGSNSELCKFFLIFKTISVQNDETHWALSS